jgi:hypothetical protein
MIDDAGHHVRNELDHGDGQAQPHKRAFVGLLGAAGLASHLAELALNHGELPVNVLQAPPELYVHARLRDPIVGRLALDLVSRGVLFPDLMIGDRAGRVAGHLSHPLEVRA